MATLPTAASFTGSTVTEAQFKTAITDLRTFLADILGTDGTDITALQSMGVLGNTVSAKTGAYTVIASDRGALIDATTGTWTLTLTAAATLGNGFAFAVRNSGTGVITVDPNSTELIDGASTVTLVGGESCICVCNGTAWRTVGKTGARSGQIRNIVTTTIAAATGTTSIPTDDTSPLSSEGTQVASTSITPVSSANTVRVRASFVFDTSAAGENLVAAVFRGSTCIGAAMVQGGSYNGVTSIEVIDSPATTSSVTYSIRVGAGGSTWYVSRTSNTLAGEPAKMIMSLEEIAA